MDSKYVGIVWPPRQLKRRMGVHRGITLTEVIVGLALLGSLLTIMLVGAGRLERQRSAAEKKLEAVAALDQLVSVFFSNGFPALPSDGPLNNKKEWIWNMSRVNTATPEGCSVARISIVDLRRQERSDIASVDVLVANSAFGKVNLVGRQP